MGITLNVAEVLALAKVIKAKAKLSDPFSYYND